MQKLQKRNLAPFFREHTWAVRPLGVMLLLTLPIWLPLLLTWVFRDEWLGMGEELLRAVVAGVEK